MKAVIIFLLLAGFSSQGGRATVTYQPTPLKGDGQGCPSDEIIAQAIEDIHSLIEERVETESTPETRLLTELNNAVESLTQEVAELSDAATLADVLLVINKPGLTRALPAESCDAIFESTPDLPSGTYWITSANGTALQAFCNRPCCGEGWTRIAYINTTDPSQQCPPELREITSPVRTCGRPTDFQGCRSVQYPVNASSYRRVCGRALAYECGHPDGLNYNLTIESHYVEGISITHGTVPRKHIWSFAASRTESATSECNCNSGGANHPVAGNDYFCASAVSTPAMHCNNGEDMNTDNPLWDGIGCSTSTCCEFNNPPWFCKTLPQPTTDDIEVRLCSTLNTVEEDTPIELLEIYIS